MRLADVKCDERVPLYDFIDDTALNKSFIFILGLIAGMEGGDPGMAVGEEPSGLMSTGMQYVAAGSFRMGNPSEGGSPAERPIHTVQVGAFWIDRYEVSLSLWCEVADWAVTHGYEFSQDMSGETNHPVSYLDWDDSVKWCNARSEKEGRAPVYYLDADQMALYRRGCANLSNDHVKWEADGYRLPTEAEWEKAARGGLDVHDFPWPGNGEDKSLHIGGNKANFWKSGHPFWRSDPYDDGSTPVGYYNGSQTPPGGDMTNGYGLYDMAGNVWEFCWDWFDPHYYAVSPEKDPRGPETGRVRVVRGGSWNSSPDQLRCSFRSDYRKPSYRSRSCGFRCVRTAGGKEASP